MLQKSYDAPQSVKRQLLLVCLAEIGDDLKKTFVSNKVCSMKSFPVEFVSKSELN